MRRATALLGGCLAAISVGGLLVFSGTLFADDCNFLSQYTTPCTIYVDDDAIDCSGYLYDPARVFCAQQTPPGNLECLYYKNIFSYPRSCYYADGSNTCVVDLAVEKELACYDYCQCDWFPAYNQCVPDSNGVKTCHITTSHWAVETACES